MQSASTRDAHVQAPPFQPYLPKRRDVPHASRLDHEGGHTIPTHAMIIAQAPPPSPTSSVPSNPANSPLGRYLVHPGQETSELVHHVLRVFDHVGHLALPGVVVIVVFIVGWKVVQLLGRFCPSAGGHLVEVRLPATVDPKRAPVFWRNIHSVLAGRRRLRRRT